jgi:hypothetical protein
MRSPARQLTLCLVFAAAALVAQSFSMEPLFSNRQGKGALERGRDEVVALIGAEVHLAAGGGAEIAVRSSRHEWVYSGTWRKDRGDYVKLALDRAEGVAADGDGWVLVTGNGRFAQMEFGGRIAGGPRFSIRFESNGPELALSRPRPQPTPTPTPRPVPGLFTEEYGYDQPGADYRNQGAPDLAFCQRLCADDPSCRAYSYNNRDQRCYLKSQERPMVRRSDTITGVKRGGAPGGGHDGFIERPGHNMEGGDYHSVYLRSLDECRNVCRGDRRCLAYTFNSRSNMCYLKDRVGSYTPRAETSSGEKDPRLRN